MYRHCTRPFTLPNLQSVALTTPLWLVCSHIVGSSSAARASSTSSSMRQKLSSNDEAKFALLEPDGVSPMRHRQRATAQATATQRKGCLVLSFSLLFILYLAYPRPSTGSWTVATGSTGSSASSSSDDTVIVAGVATNTVSATLSAGSALLAMRGQDGSTDVSDTVVVDKGTLTKVEVPTRPLDADVASTRTEGGVAIIRHVSGGDENIAPPPPPSRGAFRLFSWLRGRRKGPSQTVAHMIEKLEKDVREGASFEPAEMGQRLADIERLERREADGEQKRKDEVAKRCVSGHPTHMPLARPEPLRPACTRLRCAHGVPRATVPFPAARSRARSNKWRAIGMTWSRRRLPTWRS